MPNRFFSMAALMNEDVPGAGAPRLNCFARFKSSQDLMPVAPQA